MKAHLFAFIICTTSTAGFAQDQWIYISGAGQSSCGQYISTTNRDQLNQYAHWFYGYITGVQSGKRWKDRPSEMPDRPTIELWTTQYCASNPTHKVWMASAALLEEIGGTKSPVINWRKP